MLSIFKDLYRQAKHQVSKLVHTAKCKFYTERITLAPSSRELLLVVNTLSIRRPPKILPTIYLSADLPSLSIKLFANNVENLRANIASNMLPQHLLLGQLLQLFLHLKKCHN